jgi:hypothetical protein
MSALGTTLGLTVLCFTGNEIGVVRVDATVSASPVSVEFLSTASGGAGFLGATVAEIPKIGKAGGKKPIRYVFACDWDGDGEHEVVVVRERIADPKRRLEVKAYRAPGNADTKLGKLVGSLDSKLLTATGFSRVTALGAFDRNGDGKDELVVVRAAGAGEQRLEIYAIPDGKDKPLAAPVASDWTFGLLSDEIIALDRAPSTTASGENLVVVIRTPNEARVRILKSPSGAIAESVVLASDESFVAADGAVVEDAFTYSSSSGNPSRLALLIRAADGSARLDSFALPTSSVGDLGPVLASDPALDTPGVTDPLLEVFSIAREKVATSEPWKDLVGSLSAWFHCAYPDGAGGFTSSWIGPIPAWPSQFIGPDTIRLIGAYPNPFGASVDVDIFVPSFVSGATIPFGEWAIDPRNLAVPSDTGIAQAGDRCVFNLPGGLKIGADPAGKLRFQYTNPGGPVFGTPIGELQFPDASQPGGFGLRASITELILAK